MLTGKNLFRRPCSTILKEGIGMINFQFNIYKKSLLFSFLAYDGSREVKLYTLRSFSQWNRNIFEDACTFISTTWYWRQIQSSCIYLFLRTITSVLKWLLRIIWEQDKYLINYVLCLQVKLKHCGIWKKSPICFDVYSVMSKLFKFLWPFQETRYFTSACPRFLFDLQNQKNLWKYVCMSIKIRIHKDVYPEVVRLTFILFCSRCFLRA